MDSVGTLVDGCSEVDNACLRREGVRLYADEDAWLCCEQE
jgi:hypothetical protein